MPTTNEKLAALRRAMKEAGVSGYLIPSCDPHMSEYPPSHWESRSYFSGFNGSAGTLVITLEKSALWTDGRYFIQAERQIADSEIELMRQGVEGVPSISQWLTEQLPENCKMGLDGMTNSVQTVQGLEKDLAKKQISILSVDLVSGIWTNDRPEMPHSQCYLLDVCYSGKTIEQKLKELREKLNNLHADSMMVTRLDDLAWLLNLRADDVANTPYALAFCLVEPEKTTLFTNPERVPQSVVKELQRQGVHLCAYEQAAQALDHISSPCKMLLDASAVNYSFGLAMQKNPFITVITGEDPIQMMKGVKNEVEIENLIRCHVKDGVAMVRFQMDLENRMSRGEKTTEMDVSRMLRHYRSQQSNFLDESFVTIAAYGANAAMMHYHPTEQNCAVIEPRGLLLCDCGGQYLEGTTDITRTYAMGELTETEKRYYTISIKCHIGIATARFPAGATCGNLDALSRIHAWKYGLDYRCGTGHGVSFLGGVHEGPQSLRLNNSTVFQPGMTITDEPGIYEENVAGMRTENELLCRTWEKTEYGQFLEFTPITFVPIDTTPIQKELLTPEEIQWLNQYHQTVVEKLSPYLEPSEQQWLADKCKAI